MRHTTLRGFIMGLAGLAFTAACADLDITPTDFNNFNDAHDINGAPANSTTNTTATLTAAIITPDAANRTLDPQQPLLLTGEVTDTEVASVRLDAEWSITEVTNASAPTDIPGSTRSLWRGHPSASGRVATSVTDVRPGMYRIDLIAKNPAGVTSRASITITMASDVSHPTAPPEHDFDDALDMTVWRTFGDAYWDPNGWLEMTGNAQSRKGAIFNTSERASPGSIAIQFRIWTGGGTGADGFAMSVIGAPTVADLERTVNAGVHGGGLGYAYGPGFGDIDYPGLHIEIDTWENLRIPNGDRFDDPTPNDHIAVTLNGDPGNHVLWAAIPDIEDSQWHDVAVNIDGAHIRVDLDGANVLDGEVPGFGFKGGYLGFSGTTGYYTNYHRFDDLRWIQD